MSNASRLALLACAAVAALAFSGSAFAVPRLIIGGPGGLGSSQVSIQFREEKSDAAPLKVTFYAPAGVTGVVTGSPGTQIGTVAAQIQALAISADAIVDAPGQILQADPNSPMFQTPQAQACAAGVHTAVWNLHVTVSGTVLDVPMYVDAPSPVTDPLSLGAPFRLTVCFPSPYVPQSAGGAAFGAKVINATLQLNQGVFTLPVTRGAHTWRVIVTPYTVGTAAPNPAATVEARGVVETPSTLSIAAKVTNKKKRIVRISGTVKTGDAVIGGATVTLSGSAKAKKKTSANGSVVFTVRFKKKGTYRFQLKTTQAAFDITREGCAQATPGVPCVSAWHNAFSAASRIAKVVVK